MKHINDTILREVAEALESAYEVISGGGTPCDSDYLRMAQAAIEAYERVKPVWQPIETLTACAGQQFLASDGEHVVPIEFSDDIEWKIHNITCHYDFECWFKPTHWMPLPAPPSNALTTTSVSESKPRKMTVEEVCKIIRPAMRHTVLMLQGRDLHYTEVRRYIDRLSSEAARALAQLGAIEVVEG